MGHTAIQMGRTQGLQPMRTFAFSEAAAAALRGTAFQYFDPYNLTVARRESSFDGQHWACYHRYGGVSHTILTLMLNHVCPA
jgi:hypothetical protein